MTKLVNRAKMTTATTGTGTITLGSAVDGYQTFAAAGVADADVVRYVIEDGDAWEIGLGTYTASGTTLTRGSIESSNADNAINLTGNAVVYVSAAAADLQELVDFADNFVLPTADGSTGQVLTTNGAGTLSFTTISGYTDADVDTHLNTGTAASGEVLSWNGSDYDWVTSGGAFSVVGTRNLAAIATLPDLTTGTDNFVAGDSAGANLTTGSNNVAIGNGALDAATTGGQNIAIGTDAIGTGVVTAANGWNVAIGENALSDLTSGKQNVAVGLRALRKNTTASQNVAIGAFTLYGTGTTATTGIQNVAIGQSSGYDLTTGEQNTFVGYRSGFNLTSGANNTALGSYSLAGLTTGSNNVAIGNGALDAATTGGQNIAIGTNAMGIGVATAASGYNIAVGDKSGEDISSAVENVLLGRNSGRNITTGSQNTILASQAANSLTTGANNTVIGYDAQPSSATVSNEITLGNSSITNLRVPGVGFQFDTTDGLIVPKTVTAGGTTGAQTINKTAGTVNFAVAATSLVVTNSFVDANSIIIATVATNDTTMTSVQAVAAAGSFTLYANAAATAETRVNWFVAN